ncbi:MAG: glycosyltransferase family 9 protein, partial [Deltaproteobacteria bacterium]|nr:glycosyltransferase family 9 protein [Deltaproteobacteria bacterium]
MLSKVTPKILIVNPYGIGDVLFCTPLIRTLRKTYPKAFIAVLLGSRTEAILEFNPHINAVFTYAKDRYRSLPFLQKIHYLSKLLFTLRKQNFDIFFDLSNNDEYGFLAKFIFGIPIRIGFNYKNRGQFLTHKIKLKNGFSGKHVSEHYNSLLQFLKIDFSKIEKKLDFYTDPSQKEWYQELRTHHHIKENDTIICILPGGGASWGTQAAYRYWPSAHFGKLADSLIEQYEVKVFIIGSPSEKKICKEVTEHMKHPAIDLSGQTTLHQLGTLIEQSHLVIGSESG